MLKCLRLVKLFGNTEVWAESEMTIFPFAAVTSLFVAALGKWKPKNRRDVTEMCGQFAIHCAGGLRVPAVSVNAFAKKLDSILS